MELKEIKTVIQATLDDHQVLLSDIRWSNDESMRILQIAIMRKDGTMDLDTCAKVAETLSPILDASPLGNENYYLEVCSPGAERELLNDDEIVASIGCYIDLKVHHPLEKLLELKGYLVSYDGVNGQLMIQDKSRKKMIEFNKENIVKIRLAVKI
jgi:ribosome maturation factor RimP